MKSKISYNRIGSPSKKTTIPQGIVHYLSLSHGDAIEWTMDTIDGERVAIVKKLVQST